MAQDIVAAVAAVQQAMCLSRPFLESLMVCRQISQHVAMDVIKIAAEEGHLSSVKAMRALANSDEALLHWIDAHMYKPKYNSLIRLPTGVLE